MKTTLYLLLLNLCFVAQVKAQNYLYGPTISYQYLNGSSVKTGVYYAVDIRPRNILKLDATANFSWIQGKYSVIPELAAAYYTDMHYIGAFGRAELTPYTLSPKVGISFLTLFEIDLGYAFSIAQKHEYPAIKGFTTAIRFNIPLNSLF